MKISQKTPESHIQSLPADIRTEIVTLDKHISRIMKDDSRFLWEGVFWGGTKQKIIGYGDYTATRSDGKLVEWFVVGLAVQKNYISLYINAVEGKQYVIEKYAKTLGKVKAGKGSFSFKSLADLNLDAALELVEKAKKQSLS